MLAKMILLESNYFELAENHVELSRVFLTETWLKNISLWFDMVIHPLYLFYKFCILFETPGIFGMCSLYKCIQSWCDWFQYQFINADIHEWMSIVRSVDGPFISTNDPTYHVYVYADGMERVKRIYSL